MKKQRNDQDFADEVESHLAIECDRLIAQGMSETDARQAARRAFGNVTKQTEHFHESRTNALIDATRRNLLYAFRGLARRPAFAITAILTLAFGIGVNSALFTLLYSLLLRPPPVGDPASFVNVYRQVGGQNYGLEVHGRNSMLSWPDYLRLREGAKNLEQLSVYRRQSFTVDVGDRPVTVFGELASCNYFVTLRVRMDRGRSLLDADCQHAGDGRVVVLSYAAWQRRFGGDSQVIGKTISINRQPFTVVGIAERGFAGLNFDPSEAWIPVTMHPSLQKDGARDFERDISWLAAVGRLRADGNAAGASAELSALARVEDANWPGRASNVVVSEGTRLDDPDSRANVMIAVTGATVLGALILLMCCANVMNLLLARAASRRQEIGIRLSLGASRQRLVTQLLVESGVLATLGATLGLVLAWWLPPMLRAAAPDQELNIALTPDWWVVAVTMGIAVGASLLFGLVPALQSTNQQLSVAIRKDSGSGRGRSSRWRGAAVVAQVSVSALLLVTAAMFLRATQRSVNVDPGFAVNSVSTVTVDLTQGAYDSLRTRAFHTNLRAQLANATGVAAVAAAEVIPLRGRAVITVGARGVNGDSIAVPTLLNKVSAEYFSTMGIALVSGRAFAENDPPNPEPVVVSESFARKAWPGNTALNRIIQDNDRQFVVVGVARDVQSASIGVPDGPFLYVPIGRDFTDGHLFVRSNLSVQQLQSLATRIGREFDASHVVSVISLAQQLERQVAPVALAGRVASGLGLVAMLLAAVGVYGVVAFAVSQRSREIGIRMALGATRQSVQRMMFSQGARVVGIGLFIGILLAAGASQALRSALFGLSAFDIVAFCGVAIMLSAVSAVAVGIPAARASRVDPVASLREE